jgi:hypothetical protein
MMRLLFVLFGVIEANVIDNLKCALVCCRPIRSSTSQGSYSLTSIYASGYLASLAPRYALVTELVRKLSMIGGGHRV